MRRAGFLIQPGHRTRRPRTWRSTSRSGEQTEEAFAQAADVGGGRLGPWSGDGCRSERRGRTTEGGVVFRLVASAPDPAADSGSEASGQASLVVLDDHLQAFVFVRGLSPNLPHAMHIHGHDEAVAECPSLARAGDDGLIDTVDGIPDYGPI